MLTSRGSSKSNKMRTSSRYAKPFCECWNKSAPVSWSQLGSGCCCGEENSEVREWNWEQPQQSAQSWVLISDDKKQVTFHPFYSSGTAAVKGDTPLLLDHHYYWEVKMLSETYGTDIMIGVGTSKVNIAESEFQFISLLGQDAESYGLSYTGALRHNAAVARDCVGFCRGSVIGVRVDMWQGTLEFYLNRQPQGVSFYNLRRHKSLFPMICSTAAQSSMRLIYAASYRASLMVDAAKTLAASIRDKSRMKIPPGLWHKLRSQFWLTLPTEGAVLDEDEEPKQENMEVDIEDRNLAVPASVLSEILPSPYMNGFYVDNVEPTYRIVVWQ